MSQSKKSQTPGGAVAAQAGQRREFSVPNQSEGQRLDVWLHTMMPDLSRVRIQDLIHAGHVTISKGPVKASLRLTPGLTVTIHVPAPQKTDLVSEDIPLDVLYEDAHLLVVNKAPGMVVHPAAGHVGGTLVNAILFHCPEGLPVIGGQVRPGIVHRLDKDTSGAMVVAKTDKAMKSLARQFKTGTVGKEYLALVHGVPMPSVGRVEVLIGRSRSDRKKMAVLDSAHAESRGRISVTEYRLLERLGELSLLRLVIKTGRTHQIRVHMKHLGHPVAGDAQYGGRRRSSLDLPRQMLHAQRLTLRHPVSGERLEFKAALHADMREVLQKLGSEYREE